MKSITLLAGMVAILFSAPDAPRGQDSKPATRPAASPADVASIHAIITAVYDVISGPASQPRDWDRCRSLFMPKAQLVMAAPAPGGGTRPVVLSVDEYIERAGPHMRETGFFEREVFRHVDAWADVAQAFSTYEARYGSPDTKPVARGINSIQLMKDKDRWWIVSIFWCQETAAHPLPPEYLPAK